MNRTLKKLVYIEYKRFLMLILILSIALILSAFVFILRNSSREININYENIINLPYRIVFLKVLKKNLIYFIILTLLALMGKSKIINILFFAASILYGLSIIYLVKSMQTDKINFIFMITDYLIIFPIILYFTYISSTVSKYTKKIKNIETISHKFDIIISSYMKLSMFYILFVLFYSFAYSYYIIILCRLLVRR